MHQLDLLQSYRNTIVHGLFTDFYVIDEAEGLLASQIRARYNLSLPDSLQIAAAIAAQCDAFLTNDLDLRRVTELRVITVEELPA
jgi:predicted nucleic acid-binding protein